MGKDRSQVINAEPNPIEQWLKPHELATHLNCPSRSQIRLDNLSAIREVDSQPSNLDLPFRAMNSSYIHNVTILTGDGNPLASFLAMIEKVHHYTISKQHEQGSAHDVNIVEIDRSNPQFELSWQKTGREMAHALLLPGECAIGGVANKVSRLQRIIDVNRFGKTNQTEWGESSPSSVVHLSLGQSFLAFYLTLVLCNSYSPPEGRWSQTLHRKVGIHHLI